MSIEQMKEEIKKVYPKETWESKIERMTDKQIIAIYHRFLEEKLI